MNARIFLCIALLGLAAAPVAAQTPGQLKLPEFPTLADKASESVVVTLDSKMLNFAKGFLSDDKPDEVQAKKIVGSLTGIYVRNFTFDEDFVYPKADIDAVRRQLDSAGWSRMVEAHSKHEGSDVNVFMFVEGGKARGLAIIASEPREFTIVNIVGSINLEDLHDLEGNFGVPKLDIETGKKPADPKKEVSKKP
jgi:hypothetical protein